MPQLHRSLSCPTSSRERAQPGPGRVANESLYLHIYVTLAYLSLRLSGAKSFKPTGSSPTPRARLWLTPGVSVPVGGEGLGAIPVPPARPRGAGQRASPHHGRARGELSSPSSPMLPGTGKGVWLRCLRRVLLLHGSFTPSQRGLWVPPRATRWPWGRYRSLAEGKCKFHYVLGEVWN